MPRCGFFVPFTVPAEPVVNIFNQMGVLTISLFEHKIKTIKPVSYNLDYDKV